MFPLKNYYESFIKKEIIGMKKEDALKKLGNVLACSVITRDNKASAHIRFFTCTIEMKPNMARWLGTIALRIENGLVIESAICVPEDKKTS